MLVSYTFVEKPAFYELCDELGLLLEIELPFNQAGPLWLAKTPRIGPYKESVSEHARNIIQRLRSHPAIITWAPYAEYATPELKEELDTLFRELITREAPGTVYHWAFCSAGEDHVWVASAGHTFVRDLRTTFECDLPYVSEYGSCALSSYERIHKWMTPEEVWSERNPRQASAFHLPIDLRAYAYRTSTGGNTAISNLLHYTTQLIDGDVRSGKELVEASQLYQSFKARYQNEVYRRKKYDKLQGVRWWAYKDPAPVNGWGILDFDQVPKQAYYEFKRNFAPLAIAFAYRDELYPQPAGATLRIPVWLFNDLRAKVSLDVQCEVLDLQGHPLWTRSFPVEVDADASRAVGEVEWTLPASDTVQVYMMRATARERGGPRHCATTKYVKVVPKDAAALAKGVPDLGVRCRVLLIGDTKLAAAIGAHLRALNAETEIIDVDHFERLSELRDTRALRSKYDVIWLASFEALWKLLDDDMANGLAQAVRDGCGLVHTGGRSSFSGVSVYGSFLGLTPLAEVLPVKLKPGADWVLDVNPKLIQVLEKGWSDCGLKKAGFKAFNEVEPKPGAQVLMRIGEKPLLVSGRHGKGYTLALTAYTPEDAGSAPWRAFYGQLLMAARGDNPRYRYAAAGDSDKPQMQLLKEQPEADLALGCKAVAVRLHEDGGKFTLDLANGGRFARLIRLRVEWPDEASEKAVALLYSDNFFDLLPGEKKTIEVEVRRLAVTGRTLEGVLIVEGVNVAEQRIPLRVTAE
jgi:hypothetical protein